MNEVDKKTMMNLFKNTLYNDTFNIDYNQKEKKFPV